MTLTDDDRRAIRRTCELLRMVSSGHWRASLDVTSDGVVWVATATGAAACTLVAGVMDTLGPMMS